MNFYIHTGPHRGRIFAHQTQHFGTIILEKLAGSSHLTDALSQCFTLFSGEDFTYLGTAAYQFGANHVQDGFTLLEGTLRPTIKRNIGRGHRGGTIICICFGILSDSITYIGRVDVTDNIIPIHPLTIDIVLMNFTCHSIFLG